LIWDGLATSVARPRWNSVSRIESRCASRSSWAVSSSSVASGTGGVSGLEHVDGGGREVRAVRQELLGAPRRVPLAPARAMVALDLVAQPEDAVHEGLRPRRASRNVDVDRH